MDELMTAPELAEYLKISKSKAYYLIQKGVLPHFKLGRNVRVKRSDCGGPMNLDTFLGILRG